MKAAIVENGVVKNVVKVESEEFANQQGWIVSETANKGDLYDSETGFTAPPPEPEPVPRAVTKRQAKEALIREGKYQQALDAIANISDATEKAITENYWAESQEFQRDNPVLVSLAGDALGMTEAEIDDLFRYAATL